MSLKYHCVTHEFENVLITFPQIPRVFYSRISSNVTKNSNTNTGTNPASAVMAGMKVVVVKNKDNGEIDMDDLLKKADKHADHLAALMVTYPSTYGVFEEGIVEAIDIVRSVCLIISLSSNL